MTLELPTSLCGLDFSSALLATVVLLLFVSWFFKNRVTTDVPSRLLISQADVSKTRRHGESGIYRSHLAPHSSNLIYQLQNGEIGTLYEMFQNGKSKNAKKNYLGYRINEGPFLYFTFEEVEEQASQIGSAMITHYGLTPKSKANVGIYMANCVAWACVDHSCAFYSLVSVPLYETLSLAALVHIVQLTELSIIFTVTKNLPTLIENTKLFPTLRSIVLCDTSIIQTAPVDGVEVLTLKQLQSIGAASIQQHVPPDPNDTATVCFTNGTTGTPKGAVITHRNIVAAASGVLLFMPRKFSISSKDLYISYLSLAHTFERTLFHSLTYLGCGIAFYSGTVMKLIDDVQTLQPTIMPAIPQLLNRLYDKANSAVFSLSVVHQHLFWYSYRAKLRNLREGQLMANTIYDRIAFRRIQAKLGGRVRLIVSGTGAVDNSVMEFFRVTFGCQVLNSYGLTETCSFATLMLPGDYGPSTGFAHVGSPLPCNELKLVDVPSLNYFVSDKPNPRGEICIRGYNVVKEYYKQQSDILTNEWLHTGDIGEIYPNGTLKCIDRRRELTRFSEVEYSTVTKFT